MRVHLIQKLAFLSMTRIHTYIQMQNEMRSRISCLTLRRSATKACIVNNYEKSVTTQQCTSLHSLSTLSLWVEEPVMTQDRSLLWAASIILYHQTSILSPPWSLRTQSGNPKFGTASLNNSNTVWARLLSPHLMYVIVREKPSIKKLSPNEFMVAINMPNKVRVLEMASVLHSLNDVDLYCLHYIFLPKV